MSSYAISTMLTGLFFDDMSLLFVPTRSIFEVLDFLLGPPPLREDFLEITSSDKKLSEVIMPFWIFRNYLILRIVASAAMWCMEVSPCLSLVSFFLSRRLCSFSETSLTAMMFSASFLYISLLTSFWSSSLILRSLSLLSNSSCRSFSSSSFVLFF